MHYDHALVFPIECYDRALCILWNGQMDEYDLAKVMDKDYDAWMNDPELEDCGICVEEYLIENLPVKAEQIYYIGGED